jgi:hypothetical protein
MPLSRVNGTDQGHQLSLGHALESVTRRAGMQRPIDLRISIRGGQNDDSSVWKFSTNRDKGIGAVDSGELEIHQRNIRTMSPKLRDGFSTIRRLRDKEHVGLGANDRG